MRLTKPMLKVLSVMVQGYHMWETCTTGSYTVVARPRGKPKVMRVSPRTVNALHRQGLIMTVGPMTPIYFRQEWKITRLGEIEVFNRT